jgi:SSS family solute:Na+ symporter/sodium/pantothenate symporter
VNDEPLQLGNNALIVTGIYLLGMIAIGWLGRLSRKEETLRDFYLGGSSMGLTVLFLTLFATQYSGNTLLGFAGRAYQSGGAYIVSITFMILVITIFMVYAPRLVRLARRFGYITPADYVFHRFGSHKLRVLTVMLLCWGLANYILEQLVAMGHAVEAISSGRIEFMLGVVGLAAVMLIYESLGGMRSVAWTDVVQGTLLFAGCSCILIVLITDQGGLVHATGIIREASPEKLSVPNAAGIRAWISNLIIIGFGAAMYPHAVQRLFAARTVRTLRGSLAAMAFMPLATTLLAFMIGYIAISRYPGLNAHDSDKVTIFVLSDLIGHSKAMYWLVIIVFSAILAAIMSTADSALLTIGSMVTKDVYKPYIHKDATPVQMLRVGKTFAWAVMGLLILMAWVSERTESSLWLLIKLKLEFMVQIAPVFILGVYWRGFSGAAALAGMAIGTLLTLVIWGGVMIGVWESRSPWGLSAGVWGLGLNFTVCIIGSFISPAVEPLQVTEGAG